MAADASSSSAASPAPAAAPAGAAGAAAGAGSSAVQEPFRPELAGVLFALKDHQPTVGVFGASPSRRPAWRGTPDPTHRDAHPPSDSRLRDPSLFRNRWRRCKRSSRVSAWPLSAHLAAAPVTPSRHRHARRAGCASCPWRQPASCRNSLRTCTLSAANHGLTLRARRLCRQGRRASRSPSPRPIRVRC